MVMVSWIVAGRLFQGRGLANRKTRSPVLVLIPCSRLCKHERTSMIATATCWSHLLANLGLHVCELSAIVQTLMHQNSEFDDCMRLCWAYSALRDELLVPRLTIKQSHGFSVMTPTSLWNKLLRSPIAWVPLLILWSIRMGFTSRSSLFSLAMAEIGALPFRPLICEAMWMIRKNSWMIWKNSSLNNIFWCYWVLDRMVLRLEVYSVGL